MNREFVGTVPINGKTFTAKVHKINGAGNGIVETTEAEIILGPVKDEAVGELIEAMKLPGPFARIKRPKNILGPNYIEELQNRFPYDFSIDYGDAHANISKHNLRKHEHAGHVFEYVPEDNEQHTNLESTGANDLFQTQIEGVSNSGNGVVYIDGEKLTVGPIKESAVGNEIIVERITEKRGICKAIHARKKNYFEKYPEDLDDRLVDSEDYFEVGRFIQDKNSNQGQKGVVVNLPPIPAKDYIAYHDDGKPVSVYDDNPEFDPYASVVIVIFEQTLKEYYPEYNGERPIPLQSLSNEGIEHYAFPPERLRPIENDYESDTSSSKTNIVSNSKSKSETSPDSESDEVLAEDGSSHKYKTSNSSLTEPDNTSETQEQIESDATASPDEDEEISVTTQTEQEKDPTTDFEDSSTELDQLRENAMENATYNVSENISTTTTEKQQYNRSTEVKEYVLARADGFCEGCSDPAPFTNKKGEPYLQVHHIHELSKGGPDTPNNVIALCPNCHYRVHHGENGDEYNKELEKKLKKLENQSKHA